MGWLFAVYVYPSQSQFAFGARECVTACCRIVHFIGQRGEMGATRARSTDGRFYRYPGTGTAGIGVCACSFYNGDQYPIIVTGLKKDAKRLAMARNFGATHILCSEEGPLEEQVKNILGPEMADVVVDASGSVTAQQAAVDLVRRGGTVVLGGELRTRQFRS